MSIFRHTLSALATGAAIVAIATPAQAQVRPYDIPAGDLKVALDSYARQSGRQLIYKFDEVSSAQSPGARGRLAADAALTRLLTDSGFTWTLDPSGAIAIVRSEGAAGGPLDGSETAELAPAAFLAAEQAIVVTGSRIRRPNLESVVPVTSVSGEEFYQSGQTAIGEVLNELPALHSTVSQSNSTRLDSGAGLNMLDLRGLGINRTLVLQNGRRHISGAPFTTAVDVNAIPTDLIERVDIVTGGSSAVYGSDAIAGVVNFVLKRDFQGLQVRGQGGISDRNDAGQAYFSVTAGTNFADGRGNVAVNAEFAHQDDWYASDRDYLRNLSFYFQTDADEPNLPNGSDGIPDRELFDDVREIGFSNGGQYIVFEPGPDGNVPAYNFQPDGSLRLQSGDRIGLPPFALYNGGDGPNNRENNLFGLAPDVKRYGFNLVGHFTVSDAFEPFVEAKYVRADTSGGSVGSFFSVGIWGEGYRTDNPYLQPEARDFIRSTLGLGDGQEDYFYFGRNFIELGGLHQNNRRETYRLVGGARGKLGGNWIYEASANLARVTSRNNYSGNVNIQRFLLAIDAVRDPDSGEIVCRSSIDPSAATPYAGAANADYAAATLAADVAACAPLNPFGEGSVSDAAADYILGETQQRSRITQTVLNGFVTGDTSGLFELPGGPIGLAFGGEYRRETFRDVQDELLESGLTHVTPAAPFEPPAFSVKELFGELRAPILRELPLAHELTVSAAARVADYKGRTGTVLAWNAGVEWAPIRDIRFRMNQSHAVRAPNLVEIYQPLGQSFFSNGRVDDPCSSQAIGSGSSNRASNCAADGVPDGFTIDYLTSFPYLSGGNPELREEQSDSFTIGAVVQPAMVPGLSFSVDYYDIKVSDVITAPDIQAVLNSCYDAASIDNQFCALFDRNTSGGAGPNGEEPGQIIENSLRLVPLNYAALKVRGIDLEAAYRRELSGIGQLSTRVVYTRVLQNDSFLNPEDPGRADRKLMELGNPKHALNWDLGLKRGPITFGYQMRYLSKMAPDEIENVQSVQGRPPQDADAYEIRYFRSAVYHDVRVGLDIGDRFNVYAGVDNFTDRLPPPAVTGVIGPGIYDNVGRFFYAGAVARF